MRDDTAELCAIAMRMGRRGSEGAGAGGRVRMKGRSRTVGATVVPTFPQEP